MYEVGDKFNFFTEANFEKSTDYPVGDDRRYENMIFEGLASDNSEDSEGECMEPNGFILDRFKKHGLVNLDHLPSRSPVNKSRFWIGTPLKAEVKNNKFYVKVQLWKKSPEARAFYDKAIEMLESDSNRKPGFSIEGRALERDPNNPKRVTKALITNIAMTMTPVNANSYADIIKGVQNYDFVGENDKSDSFEEEYDKITSLYKYLREGHISLKILQDSLKKFD